MHFSQKQSHYFLNAPRTYKYKLFYQKIYNSIKWCVSLTN